jgi:PKD repeat protein
MKHVMKIFVVPLFLVFLSVSVMSGTIKVTPNNPNVEETATIELIPTCTMEPKPIKWDFGDGTVTWDMSLTMTHVYLSPGTYTIVAEYACIGIGPITVTDQKTITVSEKRRIRYTPPDPQVDETMIFRAMKFLSTAVKWNFGDGKIINQPKAGGPAVVSHAYKKAGTYTVRAWDFGGASVVTITTTVVVKKQTKGTISFTPPNPRIGEMVTVTAHNFTSPTTIRWDFGDGTIINAPPPTATHVYNQAGTYTIKAYDGGGQTLTATSTIVIFPQASITFLPNDPRPGEDIIFTAHDFFFNIIRWEFGDGSVVRDNSPPNIIHSYANTGNYTVRAYDNNGAVITAQIRVTVTPAHLLTYTPSNPRTGETVLFEAVNFNQTMIRWNFGDGTPVVRGGRGIQHDYQEEGTYTVTASIIRNQSQFPVSTTLTVTPAKGPRADFNISYIHLRFDDGKAYKVVPRNASPVVAYADIKYEGTGIMHLQWMLDGNPFKLISERLSQSLMDQTTVNSGELPGLPTMIPGIHEVTVNIISPQIVYDIPILRYYVTVGEEEEMMEVDFSNVESLEGGEVLLTVNDIQAPSQQYFILQGMVKNESSNPMPYVLMRVYLDKELIDQKMLKDLEALEERKFQTSVFNPSPERKKIYILLYNISKKPAELIFFTEMDLVHKEIE